MMFALLLPLPLLLTSTKTKYFESMPLLSRAPVGCLGLYTELVLSRNNWAMICLDKEQ